MTLDEIKEKSKLEVYYQLHIQDYVEEAKELVKKYPGGFDMRVSTRVQDLIESELDKLGVPCYSFCNGFLSIARDYTTLLERENTR